MSIFEQGLKQDSTEKSGDIVEIVDEDIIIKDNFEIQDSDIVI